MAEFKTSVGGWFTSEKIGGRDLLILKQIYKQLLLLLFL